MRPVRIGTNGNGYEQIRAPSPDGDTYHALNHHRLLLYAWGYLDSPWFEDDAREVHHETSVEWVNHEREMVALSPQDHREVDPGRARIRAPWDDLGRGEA